MKLPSLIYLVWLATATTAAYIPHHQLQLEQPRRIHPVPLLAAAKPPSDSSNEDPVIEHSYIVVFDTSALKSVPPDEINNMVQDHLAWVTRARELHLASLALDSPQSNQKEYPHQQLLSSPSSSHIFTTPLQPFSIHNNTLLGYTGYLPPETLALIRSSAFFSFPAGMLGGPQQLPIAYIEPNARVFASKLVTQTYAPWGLARISNREQLTASTFSKYRYDDRGGAGVTAYVVDSGIYVEHDDFEGRAEWGVVTVEEGDQNAGGNKGASDGDGEPGYRGLVYQDLNGHGTHCAGIIAGKAYGVAKKTRLVAVKVLAADGSGSIESVLRGLEWVVNNHRNQSAALSSLSDDDKNRNSSRGAIVNLSLGCGYSASLNAAVAAVAAAGLHAVVSAGNDNGDACEYSPASSQAALTVGASTFEDTRAWFSNEGACVDLFAPGTDVWSDFIDAPDAAARRSGTSMAAPYVGGLMAYFLALQPLEEDDGHGGVRAVAPVTPAQMRENVRRFATHNALYGVANGTSNLLAYNGGGMRDLDDFWRV